MKTIKVKLVTEKGETVHHEDGKPMIFILVDESSLRSMIKSHRNDYSFGWNAAILKILGEST